MRLRCKLRRHLPPTSGGISRLPHDPSNNAGYTRGVGCRRQRPNYLPPSAWYEYLLAQPEGPELAEAVVTAMEHIEAYNATLAGILPKAYRGFEPRLLMDLLKTFNRDTLKNPSGDVFGKIYEYFLNKFAQTGAQEGGSSSSPA